MTGVVGVILAGGLSRRMGGGDKGLLSIAGKPMLSWVIERVTPQVETVILNANGDEGRFAECGLPVVADRITGYAGPLAGILTGMEWAAEHRPDCAWIATFPSDAPLIPTDMVAHLLPGRGEDDLEIGCAMSQGRTHPVCAVWRVSLAADLRTAMEGEGMRKIDAWTARHRIKHVDFAADPVDPFFNVNTKEDLDTAEQLLRTR